MARFLGRVMINVAVLCALAPLARGQGVEAAEAAIRAAWAETTSVVAALAMDATVVEMPVSGVGEVRVLNAGDATYYDQEIQLDFPAPMGVTATIKTHYDGSDLYVVNSMLGEAEAFKTEPAISEAPPPPDTDLLLDAVKARYTLATTEGDNVDERATVWLEGTREGEGERVERIRIGFDEESGFPLQIELFTADAPDPVVLRHTALRVNVALEAEEFVFEAPEDVEVQPVDASEAPASEEAEAPAEVTEEEAPAEEATEETGPEETAEEPAPDSTEEPAADEDGKE